MNKKLPKSIYKKILPKELYFNALLGKRRGLPNDYTKAVNTKLKPEEFEELRSLLTKIGVKRSAFVRYAIAKLKQEIEEKTNDYNEG